jgi:tRNA threonylcarbamoyladenosine biosynthesis protein TsaB
MLVLGLDTTTTAGSIALADGGTVMAVVPIDPSHPVATRLPGDLAALLDRRRLRLDDIAVFAVATGPGSFTGLRIGIATMQGLAVATGKPLIGVSAFEALATFAGARRVAVWIDAWRGEVYAATYAAEETALRATSEPIVASPAAILRSAGSSGPAGATVFIGDAAVKYRDLLAPRPVIEPTPLIAGAIARLAAHRFAAGEAPPPHAVRPLYVRRPDAELARERSAG